MSSDNSDELVMMPPKPPRGTSIRTFERVCAASELLFRQGGKVLPLLAEIAGTSGLSVGTVASVVNTTEFKHEMFTRGVRWSAKEGLTNALTPEQVYCLGIITDPSNKKPLSEKLKRSGVPYRTYRNWLKNPDFSRRLSEMGEQLLGDNIAAIHTRLVGKAEAGDIQAIKLYYEVSGRHDPTRQQTVDIMRLIGLVLESVTRHVRDPEALASLSSDLDIIMSGGVPDDDGLMPNNYVPSPAMIAGTVLPHHSSDADMKIDKIGSSRDDVSLPVVRTKKELEIIAFLKKNGLDPKDYA